MGYCVVDRGGQSGEVAWSLRKSCSGDSGEAGQGREAWRERKDGL